MSEILTYPYIRGTEILVTEQTSVDNVYTWHPNVGLTELELLEKFIPYIEGNSTILDLGAQSGCFSLAGKYYPNTTWHAFEPDPLNYSLLVDNLKLNDVTNVKTYKVAMSNTVGKATLKSCTSHKGLNTLGENVNRFSKEDTIDYVVETNTIDNLFLDTKIDLIKMDTEGSEYDIIMGGLLTIEKYKPKMLLEYCEDNLNQFGKSRGDLDRLIEEIGYEVSWLFSENILIQPRIK